ncbi:MAG: hypothetical protein OSJ69_11915 [Acetatifactor sp.]|nr:hypothetical protein [Acetatifactor sp.]
MRASLEDAQVELGEGIEQMKGPQYSRIILNTIYPEEATETTAFFDDLTNTCEEQLTGEYHLIGNSAMTYEMQQSFDQKCCLSRCFDIYKGCNVLELFWYD